MQTLREEVEATEGVEGKESVLFLLSRLQREASAQVDGLQEVVRCMGAHTLLQPQVLQDSRMQVLLPVTVSSVQAAHCMPRCHADACTVIEVEVQGQADFPDPFSA